VCETAAQCFNVMQSKLGGSVIDTVVPLLLDDLKGLDKEKADLSLQGLCQLLVLRGRDVMQVLVPMLLAGGEGEGEKEGEEEGKEGEEEGKEGGEGGGKEGKEGVVRAGSRLQVKLPKWEKAYFGVVKEVTSSTTLHMLFDDGTEETNVKWTYVVGKQGMVVEYSTSSSSKKRRLSLFQAETLAAISETTGGIMHHHINEVMAALVRRGGGEERERERQDAVGD
jgi:hypothetical protein